MTIDWNAFTPGTAAAVDLAGTWDPSLAFAMAGAIAVGVIAFAFARKRTVSVLGLQALLQVPCGARRAAKRVASLPCPGLKAWPAQGMTLIRRMQ